MFKSIINKNTEKTNQIIYILSINKEQILISYEYHNKKKDIFYK